MPHPRPAFALSWSTRAALALCLQACAGHAALPAVDASTPTSAASASNRFGFALYRQARSETENFIYSPLSVSVALNMTLGGARGETFTEMANALRVDATQVERSHASFASLCRMFNGMDGQAGMALRVSNRLWGQTGPVFRDDFLALMRDLYTAPLDTVDFSQPAQAADTINAWASHATRKKIEHLLSPGDVSPATRLVLTNAVYFKDLWVESFAERSTHERPFHTASGSVVAVKMMSGAREERYAHVGEVAVVELPYRGGLRMLIALPDANVPLAAVEADLTARYPTWVAKLEPRLVDPELPRWTTRTSAKLGPPLRALGMKRAFDSNAADFGGMAEGHGLFISEVIHQAFIEVNESGTEAAAATAVIMQEESFRSLPERVVFHADRPFFYLLREPHTDAILFLGRVVNPT